jgi:hypothetical protein
MPIKQKHYDARGRYTGETVVKTADETLAENEAFAEVVKGAGILLVVGVGLVVVYSILMFIVDVLSHPEKLDAPHRFFAYYYHYFSRLGYWVLTGILAVANLLYDTPFDVIAWLKNATRFRNLNLIFWLIGCLAYIVTLLFVAGLLLSGLAKMLAGKGFVTLAGGAVILFGPAGLWISYSVLAAIVGWVFT